MSLLNCDSATTNCPATAKLTNPKTITLEKILLTPATLAEDYKTFNDLFVVLQEDLTAAGLADNETVDAFRWFKQVGVGQRSHFIKLLK